LVNGSHQTRLNILQHRLSIIYVVLALFIDSVRADDTEPVHYAYANYLGSGIYRTTGQNASLVSLPFSYSLGNSKKISYELRLPVSVGFFDFDLADLPSLDLPDGIGTVTFTPGLAINYQASEEWLLETYIDLGYGRNLTQQRGVTIHSSGVSALYHFNLKDYDSIWATRLYYALYNGNGYNAKDSYAALQTGIDLGLPRQYQLFGYNFQPRFFATAFWYFSEVDFLKPLTKELSQAKHVTLSNSIEYGFTLKFAKKIGFSWAGIDRVGLSYRHSKNLSAFRLLFSVPI
jgi:hypothetical protein